MATTQLELRQRQVGPWPMNTYALICPTTRQSVLFDPGADPEKLMEMLDGSTSSAILLTHTHGDHVGALAEMRERLGVPVMAHSNAQPKGITAEHWLADGDAARARRFRVQRAAGAVRAGGGVLRGAGAARRGRADLPLAGARSHGR